LLLVGLISGWVSAQVSKMPHRVTPMVMSGGDLGFRVESTLDGTALGTLVVKVNGNWVPAKSN